VEDDATARHLAYSYSETSKRRVQGQVIILKWQQHKLFSGAQKKEILRQRKKRNLKRKADAKEREMTEKHLNSVVQQLKNSSIKGFCEGHNTDTAEDCTNAKLPSASHEEIDTIKKKISAIESQLPHLPGLRCFFPMLFCS
jgi:wobble nucleotide-excising tRNase